jgi:4-amino-4-deoxy-L-arabinose transferase-like glycosyltransferase
MSAAASAGRGLRSACWTLLLVGLLVATAARWLTLDVNILNVDEASYAAAAVRALDTGSIVLKASRDNKPPGIVAVYAAVFEGFGRYRMPAIRATALAVVLATSGLLFLFMRRWLSPAAGAAAAGFYALCASLDIRFLAFKTELLMNLPLCAAIGLSLDALLREGRPTRLRHLQQALAGLCLALAITTRQTAALIFVGVWVGLAFSTPWRRWSQLSASALACVAGAALGLGLIAMMYLRADAWPELWRQAVEFPRDFASAQRYSVGQRLVRFVTYVEEYMRYAQILVALALYGLVTSALRRPVLHDAADRRLSWATAGGLVASVVAFAAAPDMYPAYFLQLFLPLALALALTVHGMMHDHAATSARQLVAFLLTLAAASASVMAMKDPVKHALRQSRLGQHHALDATLRTRAAQGDGLYVWGFRPQFYLNTGLTPATRFTLTDVLVGLQGEIGASHDASDSHPYYEPNGWQQFMAELDRERPRFIIDASYMANIDARLPISHYPALHAYVHQHYRTVDASHDHVTLYERIDPQR